LTFVSKIAVIGHLDLYGMQNLVNVNFVFFRVFFVFYLIALFV